MYVALIVFLGAGVVTFALGAVPAFNVQPATDETVWAMGDKINGKPFRDKGLSTRPIKTPKHRAGGGGPRHPGGRTCAMALPGVIVKTGRAMWVHRRELWAEVSTDGA